MYKVLRIRCIIHVTKWKVYKHKWENKIPVLIAETWESVGGKVTILPHFEKLSLDFLASIIRDDFVFHILIFFVSATYNIYHSENTQGT